MSHDQRPVPPPDQPERPPGVLPAAGSGPWPQEPEPARADRPRLDAARFWAGAGATVLVCALLGLAAEVILDGVLGLDLQAPPDLVGLGSPETSWALAGALFALAGAAVLHLLVLSAPRPRMFFGWVVTLATVILAALPFTGSPALATAAATAAVWVLLGIAVWSMLTRVLGRTLVRA